MKAGNEDFRRLLEEAIGAGNASVAFSAFDSPASVSVRMNPYKPERTFAGSLPVPWSGFGRILKERPVFTLDPMFHAGAYYVQDSSSMFVGHVFRKMLGRYGGKEDGILRVLDLCAAPGGKTTDLAASLRKACGDRFILVANEVMKNRASVLAGNVAVWGDPNVVVTSDDPSAFASLKGYFDIILADVPCSGEGMFRKDPEAEAQWSLDNVNLCAARQKRILADVWPALAPGGILIYSTCTFNRYENDGNLSWAAAELDAGIIAPELGLVSGGVLATENGYSLVPGLVPGEGQYCGVLLKADGERRKARHSGKNAVRISPEVKDRVDMLFNTEVVFGVRGEMVKAVPECIAADAAFLESELHVLASGCAAGCMKGRDFVPDADLALSYMLADGAFGEAELDMKQALAFLRKENVFLPDARKGYLVVKYGGARLGFVKNIGSRCNNLHPQGRRIRMGTENVPII